MQVFLKVNAVLPQKYLRLFLSETAKASAERWRDKKDEFSGKKVNLTQADSFLIVCAHKYGVWGATRDLFKLKVSAAHMQFVKPQPANVTPPSSPDPGLFAKPTFFTTDMFWCTPRFCFLMSKIYGWLRRQNRLLNGHQSEIWRMHTVFMYDRITE